MDQSHLDRNKKSSNLPNKPSTPTNTNRKDQAGKQHDPLNRTQNPTQRPNDPLDRRNNTGRTDR